MHINVLGTFLIQYNGCTIGPFDWPRRKAGHLFKLLSISREYKLHRDQVIDALWPNQGVSAAANNLRVTLHAARAVIRDRLGIEGLIVSTGDFLSIQWSDGLVFDLDEFDKLSRYAHESGSHDALLQAITIYQELLPEDRYEEWTLHRRDELATRFSELCLAASHHAEQSGDYARGIQILYEAISREPTFEATHYSLIRVLALSGRRDDALQHFERLRDELSRSGLEPGQEVSQLVREIETGQFPGIQPLEPERVAFVQQTESGARARLPSLLTRFVGRREETIQLAGLLERSRLVTISGMGGCGKTRLALEVASQVQRMFEGRVCLVELAPVSNRALVVQSLATALGVREPRRGQLIDAMINEIRDSSQLVVLDNCEHVVGATADVVNRLLTRCPKLHVFATSREPLSVPGETVFELSPMPIPERGSVNRGKPMVGSDCVELFIDRAVRTRPGLVIDSKAVQHIVEICRQLEGLPLAIELAASRVGILSVEEIAQRLADSRELLASSSRGTPPRHRTLRAALEWSFDLLDADERQSLLFCAVFAGGFSIEAAEEVTGRSSGFLDVLESLVNKSLIRRESLTDGTIRFGMLDTVRTYALEQLVRSGELERARSRHGEYFLEVAVRIEPRLYSADTGHWLDALEREHDNLRSALEWFSSQSTVVPGLRLAAALAPFWWMRGYLTVGLEQLELMLSLVPNSEQTAKIRAEALGVASALAESRDDYENAIRLGEESLRLFKTVEGQSGIYVPYLCLGVVSYKTGDRDTARTYWESALEAATVAGSTWHVGMALNNLGSYAIGEQDFEQAEHLLTRSLEISRETGNRPLIAQPLAYLGHLAALKENHDLAERLLEDSKALFDEVGDRRFSGRVSGSLASVLLTGGRVDEAIAMCVQSIDRLWSTGERYHLCQSLSVYAQALATNGEDIRAVEILGAVDALRVAIHSPVPPEGLEAHNETIAVLRGRLSTAEFELSFETGSRTYLAELVDSILKSRSA